MKKTCPIRDKHTGGFCNEADCALWNEGAERCGLICPVSTGLEAVLESTKIYGTGENHA